MVGAIATSTSRERRANQEKASNRTGHDHEVGIYILAAATLSAGRLRAIPRHEEGKQEK